MRKKSNLESRLESCKNQIPLCRSTSVYRKEESQRYNIVDLKELFKNDNPVYLEIGCGKGKFIIENAVKLPHRNANEAIALFNIICNHLCRGMIVFPLVVIAVLSHKFSCARVDIHDRAVFIHRCVSYVHCHFLP